MQIVEIEEFTSNFFYLPDNIKRKAKKVFKLLSSNLRHPSLRLKKLKGYQDIWYARIDKNYRFTFQIQGEFIIIRRVGLHNPVIKKP